MPTLICKAHEAKPRGDRELIVWGTGTPRREFLHGDDGQDACVYLMKVYSDFEHVNVASREDVTILELTKIVCKVIGFEGAMAHDLSKPDGTPRKLMSKDKIRRLG